jgi:hypothetical protein
MSCIICSVRTNERAVAPSVVSGVIGRSDAGTSGLVIGASSA